MSSLAQSSPTLQNRYTNVARSQHTRFDQGMMRDVASWELPEGGSYDIADGICDYIGKVRKRGGTTAPLSSSAAAVVESILGYKSNGVDGVTGLWGSTGKGGAGIYSFNPSTGVNTLIASGGGSADAFACRPFQHGNLMVFPFQALGTTANDRNYTFFAGGGTGTSATVTAATIASGDNRVTGLSVSVTAAMLGSVIELDDSLGAATHHYAGRIVEVTSSSAVRVEPIPTASFTADSGAINACWTSSIFGTGDMSGRYGVSYQNRIVYLGTLNVTANTTAAIAKGLAFEPNMLRWTLLPTEPTILLGGTAPDGNNVLYPGAFTGSTGAPLYNFLDFPSLGGGTALAVAGEGQLIVFGPRSAFRVTGQLDTETEQAPAFDFSAGQISANVGCIAQRSLQYTRSGLVFAGFDNLYAFDGSAMQPLLTGRNMRYFQDRVNAGAKLHGSAYSVNRNHYILSMSDADGAIVLDLDTYALTRGTGVALNLFDSTPDPTNAAKLWGVRWWDTTTTAPTMTHGQLHAIDPIFLPAQANSSDGDGTAVILDVQTASYLDGALSTNKLPQDVQLTYDLRGTGSPTATVKVDTKLNTSDATYATVTSTLANTGSVALTKNLQIGTLVAEGQAVEFRFTTNAACASCEILGLDIGTQHRPEGFST